MKWFWSTLMLCAVGIAGLVFWRTALPDRVQPAPAVNDAGPSIQQIAELSALTTLRVDVADAVVSTLPGQTGSVRAVLIVKGSVLLGVNLSDAGFEQVDRNARTAVLRLPQPILQSVTLDQEKTRLLDVRESGLWQIVPGGQDADTAAVNHAYRDAQRIVATAAQDSQTIQRCRQQTENVVRWFLKALGWEARIVWTPA